MGDSFSNGECIRTGSEWKSKLSALNCKFEMCYQLGRGNKLLEQSIDKGENPVGMVRQPFIPSRMSGHGRTATTKRFGEAARWPPTSPLVRVCHWRRVRAANASVFTHSCKLLLVAQPHESWATLRARAVR